MEPKGRHTGTQGRPMASQSELQGDVYTQNSRSTAPVADITLQYSYVRARGRCNMHAQKVEDYGCIRCIREYIYTDTVYMCQVHAVALSMCGWI